MDSNYLTKKNYSGIDLGKLVFSILVLIAHLEPFNDYVGTTVGNALFFYSKRCLCQITVPFFFTCTGFLLFKNYDWKTKDFSKIGRYILKILRLFGLWTCITYVVGSQQLWYLPAIVQSLIIVMGLIKCNVSLKHSFIISFVLYVIGCAFDAYYNLTTAFLIGERTNIIQKLFNVIISKYELLFKDTKNGIFMGLIFVLIGIYFAKKEVKIKKPVAILGLLVSMILLFLEATLVHDLECFKGTNMYFSMIPIDFFIFYLTLKIDIKENEIIRMSRTISSIIFFSHVFIYKYLTALFSLLKIEVGSVLRTMIVLSICSFLGMMIYKIRKKGKYPFLDYLYK